MKKRKSKTHAVLRDSGNVEFYTPAPIIEAARATMLHHIDLDPASCAKANETVRAGMFYTKEMDGLTRKWFGTVWLNHPFSRANNATWIEKLISEFMEQNTTEACSITYASTSEAWFRPLLNFPQCFLWPRTNYYGPDGKVVKGVQKGSVVTYPQKPPKPTGNASRSKRSASPNNASEYEQAP